VGRFGEIMITASRRNNPIDELTRPPGCSNSPHIALHRTKGDYDNKSGALLFTRKVSSHDYSIIRRFIETRSNVINVSVTWTNQQRAIQISQQFDALQFLRTQLNDGAVAVTISNNTWWTGDQYGEKTLRFYNRLPTEDDIEWTHSPAAPHIYLNRAMNMKGLSHIADWDDTVWDEAEVMYGLRLSNRIIDQFNKQIEAFNDNMGNAFSSQERMMSLEEEVAHLWHIRKTPKALALTQSALRSEQHRYNQLIGYMEQCAHRAQMLKTEAELEGRVGDEWAIPEVTLERCEPLEG